MNKAALLQGLSELTDALISWYKIHGRSFPWRKERDPFKILVAELLLRKTRSEQVLKIYQRFFERYPTLEALASAWLDELKELLKPLGLVKRALQLKELAAILLSKYGGAVPTKEDELLSLPGIGRYTANAVLCMAYGKPKPMLDSNFGRVLSRLIGMDIGTKRYKDVKELWKLAERVVPRNNPREFNLAMIDLGSLVCKPKNPECGICPVKRFCAFARQREANLQA